MIDPSKITNYHLSHEKLEEQLLFWVFAAGHSARSTVRGIDKLLTYIRPVVDDYFTRQKKLQPFTDLRHYEEIFPSQLPLLLKDSGLGCWSQNKKTRTVRELIYGSLNLKKCGVEDLEAIHGIGPKTARCFVMHTREGARHAGLDTHLLKFLADQNISVPKSTPTSKKYKVLEDIFLRLCDDVGKTPAEYDLEIWNAYSQGKKIIHKAYIEI